MCLGVGGNVSNVGFDYLSFFDHTCVCIPEPEKTEEKETEIKDDKLPEEISQSPSSVTQSMTHTSDTGTSLTEEYGRCKWDCDVYSKV